MTELERTELGINFGVLAGLAFGIFDFTPIIISITKGLTYSFDQLISFTIVFVVLMLLTFGIYKKSRVSSIILFLLVMVTKISIFKRFELLDFFSRFSFYNFLIPVFLFISIIATFKFHKLKKKSIVARHK